MLLIINQLIHVNDSFPVVLPHKAKECIKGHNVVIEVDVDPGGIHTAVLISGKFCYNVLVNFSPEEFKSNTCIYEI